MRSEVGAVIVAALLFGISQVNAADATNTLKVFPMHNAQASQVVEVVHSFVSESARIAADARINTLAGYPCHASTPYWLGWSPTICR